LQIDTDDVDKKETVVGQDVNDESAKGAFKTPPPPSPSSSSSESLTGVPHRGAFD
jgi:hypothetical protein